ncbi:MAG: hypothetical protein R3249_00085 [Nitriliruptorales bacterium]|nr:hypothetical protein [Nitriliruptorales bacterium]
METIPKPDELLALHDVAAELFDMLRDWFDVPEAVTLDLKGVDSAVEELGDPMLIMAMAMRKLQALRLLATPGVQTSTDVVVSIVQDLNRALIQAPSMRLEGEAEITDWDAALAELMTDPEQLEDAPLDVDDDDPEASRFRMLHRNLHDAALAVLEASDGEIKLLE